MFVTLEGPEGGGKSTQARVLARRLQALSYDVLLTREPGGTPFGETIREILLGSRFSAMLPETEALLNSAARAQHVAEVIRPALESGKLVLCDRFLDSTLAYQGAGRGLDLETLAAMQRFATRGLWPDLTLLFDVPYAVGQARRAASGEPLNRFDSDARDFHERIRQYFLDAARSQPGRWHVIDASASPDLVEREAFEAVARRLHAEDGHDLRDVE